MSEGRYAVTICQQGPSLLAGEFDTVEEAEAFARSIWGSGSVGIHPPDGSEYDFDADESWRMLPYINLIRLRDDKLNPRQQSLLEQWKGRREFRAVLRGLSGVAQSPDQVLAHMEGLTDDAGKARALFMESLVWGLFEIIRWVEGFWMPTCERVNDCLTEGRMKSL